MINIGVLTELFQTIRDDLAYIKASMKETEGVIAAVILLTMASIDAAFVLFYSPDSNGNQLIFGQFLFMNLLWVLVYALEIDNCNEHYRVYREVLLMGIFSLLLWIVKIMIL